MNERPPFNPLQAQQVAEAFNAAGADYLFIGKSGAILLGYPGTTQDVDLFPAKSEENGRRMVAAMLEMGFELDDTTQAEIINDSVNRVSILMTEIWRISVADANIKRVPTNKHWAAGSVLEFANDSTTQHKHI